MQTSTWCDRWQGNVRTEDDLVRFVDDIGCCTIDRLPKYPDFPSQGVAMGRDSVLGETWFWKDDLHTDRRLYYTRIFAGKPGYISLELLPAFIATNGAVMDELALTGGATVLERELYRLIEEMGPIPIKSLKKQLGEAEKRAAAQCLINLESRFLITKVDITGRERGTYGYVWDLTERFCPEALAASDRLGVKRARAIIRERLASFGIPADSPFYSRALGWPAE
ncbi:MAG: AlkZ-related protein [Armatimonadota bacterium]